MRPDNCVAFLGKTFNSNNAHPSPPPPCKILFVCSLGFFNLRGMRENFVSYPLKPGEYTSSAVYFVQQFQLMK